MVKTFNYTPSGVCSNQMIFEIDGRTIVSYKSIGGCPGNMIGVKQLIEGMDIDDVIAKLKGIRCGGRPTSCPNAIAEALLKYKTENALIEPSNHKAKDDVKLIKLFNRDGNDVSLVNISGDKYELCISPAEFSDYLGITTDTDAQVISVDPSGGPYINVGRSVKDIVDTKNSTDVNGLVVGGIAFEDKKVVITLKKEKVW